MDIVSGQAYTVIFENGHTLEGTIDDIRYLGGQLYSFWIDIGGQPVYIAASEVREIKPKA